MEDETPEPELSKTEEHIKVALDLVIGGVDPGLITKIMLEWDLTPAKAETIIRWAKAKAKYLGWL